MYIYIYIYTYVFVEADGVPSCLGGSGMNAANFTTFSTGIGRGSQASIIGVSILLRLH